VRAATLEPVRRAPPPASRAPWVVAAGVLVAVAAVGALRIGAARAPARAAVPAPLARGLIGYWSFDEAPGSTVARDGSGNGNDCVVRGAGGQAAFRAGHRGGALALAGSGWLECARPEPLARLDRALSIAVWARPARAVAGRQAIVARQLGDANQDYFLLALNGDTLEVQSNLWESATKRRVPRPAGEWFHVAAVQGPDGRRTLYLDGVEIGRSNKSRAVALGGGTTPLTIGGAVNGPTPTASERFEGELDELALYDRALTEAEVRALAAGQRPAL